MKRKGELEGGRERGSIPGRRVENSRCVDAVCGGAAEPSRPVWDCRDGRSYVQT